MKPLGYISEWAADQLRTSQHSTDSVGTTIYKTLADACSPSVAVYAEPLPWPPTPEMLDALRTGSRKDFPSDELCRIRYAALRALLMKGGE